MSQNISLVDAKHSGKNIITFRKLSNSQKKSGNNQPTMFNLCLKNFKVFKTFNFFTNDVLKHLLLFAKQLRVSFNISFQGMNFKKIVPTGKSALLLCYLRNL